MSVRAMLGGGFKAKDVVCGSGPFPERTIMRSAVSRHVVVVSQLDRERPGNLASDLQECGHRLLSSPVALQLPNEPHNTDHLAAGQFDAAQCGLMRLN